MSDFPKSRPRGRDWVKGRLGIMALLLVIAGAATGQTPRDHVVVNFKDVDFTELVEAVSVATGKSFIIDPRIHTRVTMISTTAMSPAAFYEAFLAVLRAYRFVAVTDRSIVTIRPDTDPDWL